MKEYKECYIAFLDLLGFKNMISHKTCAEILEIFEIIKVDINKVNTDKNEVLYHSDKLKIKVISDSICFYIEKDVENSFLGLVAQCAVFQSKLLKLDEPVLIRGAITEGELYAKDDITFGPGLTDAYLLEEKNSKFPRIILLGETVIKAKEKCLPKAREGIDKLLYYDFDAYYSIDYCRMFCSLDTDKNQGIILKEYIYNVLNKEKDSSVREKYLYLEKRLTDFY